MNTTPQIRAAAYMRMSTEHQQYSTANQEVVLQQYAEKNNLQIVQTYIDAGKSGLSIDGRDALKRLLNDVESGKADFSIILVYDISRWGRFQDTDESTWYELRCKYAGVLIRYCAEQFPNDGGVVSNILKEVSRAEAGDFSRKLSARVFIGQSNLIRLGYRQGGPAGFGLRRQLINHTGSSKGMLSRGEHKSIQTDRVILVPGPDSEIKTVNDIYRSFVEEGRNEREIATSLNKLGIKTDLGRFWTRGTIHQILINEKYIGNNVWNRGSFKLKKHRQRNTREDWIRADNVFEPIVDKSLFSAAQAIIQARSYRLSDSEMLDALKGLLKQKGVLSGLIIDEAEKIPSSSAYQNRFGSLVRCYSLIGYDPGRDYRYIEINRLLRKQHAELIEHTKAQIIALGGQITTDPDTDLMRINQEFSVSLVLSRCRETATGSRRWIIRFDTTLYPDITVAIRMAPDGTHRLDYYLLPALDMQVSHLTLADTNEASLDIYRFDTLDPLFMLAKRTALKEI